MRLWRGGATYTMMWRMQSFTTFDGRSLAFLDVGSGPAVVLLHGSGSKAEGCFGPRDRHEGLIAPLSSTHRVLGLDARGHGASDKPLEPAAYAARAMARDVSALLDHLRVPDRDVRVRELAYGARLDHHTPPGLRHPHTARAIRGMHRGTVGP